MIFGLFHSPFWSEKKSLYCLPVQTSVFWRKLFLFWKNEILYLMMSSCVFIVSVLVLVNIHMKEIPTIHSPKSMGLVYLRTLIFLMNL